MKILIIGAGGQVGRALMTSVPEGVSAMPVTRAELELGDSAAIAAAIDSARPDAIINAAAYTAVDRAEGDADTANAINRDAARAAAAAATNVGARLVHISTDFVFDGASSSPYSPDAAPSPLGVYGVSKLAGEQAVAAAAPDALIVRTAWVYGVHGANFVKTMLRVMAERPEVRVVADQVGTPTHAASLARAIWTLVANRASGTHHFTDAGVASWYDFAVAIQEEALALGLLARAVPVIPIRTEDYPTPARRPAYSVLDKTSMWALLGAPANHWRQELRLMLSDLKADM